MGQEKCRQWKPGLGRDAKNCDIFELKICGFLSVGAEGPSEINMRPELPKGDLCFKGTIDAGELGQKIQSCLITEKSSGKPSSQYTEALVQRWARLHLKLAGKLGNGKESPGCQ